MWFKQIQYFNLKPGMAYDADALTQALEALTFTPCLPALPWSMGFTSPFDHIDAPMVHAANGYLMLCLQIEEKILPASVVRQTVQDRIKVIEHTQDRKVPYKEKQALQADIMATLLPRAFSRFKRLYAYIDTQRSNLVLNTTNPKEIGYFLSSWEKVLPEYALSTPDLKELNYVLTQWLQHHTYPEAIAIEKSCVLQDPTQQSRTIRCQQQNLSANAIQSLLDDGCQVKQLALSWQDRVTFNLTTEFFLKGLDFQDKLQTARESSDELSKQQQFDTDFVLMTETIAQMMQDLLAELGREAVQTQTAAKQRVPELA